MPAYHLPASMPCCTARLSMLMWSLEAREEEARMWQVLLSCQMSKGAVQAAVASKRMLWGINAVRSWSNSPGDDLTHS